MSSKAQTAYIKEQFETTMASNQLNDQDGSFQYTEEGFYLKNRDAQKLYAWNDIVEIAAYKIDLMTTDDLRLDITFSDYILTLSEDLPGFALFVDKLSEALSIADKAWERKVLKEPFEANYTIVYMR